MKELQLGNNRVEEISLQDIENIPNVKILDLRENKLKSLPEEITGILVMVLILDGNSEHVAQAWRRKNWVVTALYLIESL